MSSENSSSPQPDTDSPGLEAPIDAVAAERALLDITKLEEWRTVEFERLAQLREAAPVGDRDYVAAYTADIENSLSEYLKQQRIDEASPNYDKVRALYREAAPDRIRGDAWYIPPAYQDGVLSTDRVSAREKAMQTLSDFKGGVEHTEDIGRYKDNLKKLRETYSKKLAERSKKMGLFERPRTIAEMQAVREEMADYIGALATEMMDDFEAQGIPKDIWVDKIDAFIDAEMAAVVGGMELARADDFRKRSKVVQRGLEKWASWATPTVEKQEGESRIHHFGRSVLTSMTNINTWKKAGVFMGLGAGIGALAIPAFGFALGTAGIAGGAALVSKQIARSLVGAKLDSAAGAETIAHQQTEDITARMAAIPEGTHYDLLELAENMAEGYRKYNRNRLLGGMAISIAAGATVGGLIHQFVDFNLLFGKVGEAFQNALNHSGNTHTIPVPESGSSLSNPGTIAPWPQPPETLPPPGGTGQSHAEVINEYLREHAAARHIDNGEGWFQTFKELGVKQGDWHELLQKVGPKLHEIRYGGVRAAYWDNNAHEWRINMTENGKMSPEALRTIVKTANSEGFLKHSLDLSDVHADASGAHVATEIPGYDNYEVGAHPTSGIPTVEAANQIISNPESIPANTVGHREGWFQTLSELKKAGVIDIPSRNYDKFLRVAGPQLAKIHYSDGTPVAYYHHLAHEWRMYDSPDGGRLHPQAIRLLEQLARQSAYTKAA